MIIKAYEYQKIKKLNHNIFLFYGENEGYKNQIIEEVFLNKLKLNATRLDENEVINNFDNFITDLTNKSFFDYAKLIVISRVSEKIIKLIDELIDRKINDVKIVLNSNSLDKRSKLRSFFEKNKELICTPFYKDNDKSLSILANNFFKKNKLSASQEIINLIVERSSGDRINLNNELNKIYLFSLNKEKINIEDVLELTNLAENYNISELVDNSLAQNKKRTLYILNENSFASDDCILILRIYLSKLKRLLKIKSLIINNNNLDQAISAFKPPIFWKDKDLVKQQIKNWSLNKTYELIDEINKIELDIKKNSSNSINILLDFILNTSKTNN